MAVRKGPVVRLQDGQLHTPQRAQGLENRLIIASGLQEGKQGAIRRKQRLGGMLNYYYRQAA